MKNTLLNIVILVLLSGFSVNESFAGQQVDCNIYYNEARKYEKIALNTKSPEMRNRYYNIADKYYRQYDDCIRAANRNKYYQGYRKY